MRSPLGTVMSQVHRGRIKLRLRLAESLDHANLAAMPG
jgi:DNA-directed RNA polymerase specialized sigma24 family protein